MLVIACISLLALMVLGVPITFSLLGAGFLAVSLGGGGLPMYMNCRGFISGVNSFTLMAQSSTIGRLSLNHRVRDENGCVPQTHRD